METQEIQVPPKKSRKTKAEIVPLAPPIELRLGSLAIQDPKEMIHRAAQLADALAQIITQQGLYTVIKNKKYVWAEGWTTMGAMLGVVPIEESCEPLPDGKGFKAKIKLVRLNDGMQVGGASAICKVQEKGWNPDDDYATHSKAITRATGKAFRLSFAWIMKLAGFEATPLAEMFEVEGSQEDADQVAQTKIADHEAKKAKREENKLAKVSAFITWPEAHNGHKFFLSGKTAIMEHGLWKFVTETCGGSWNDREAGFFMSSELAPGVRKEFAEKKCPVIERDYTGLLQESIANAKAKTSGAANPSPQSLRGSSGPAAPETFDQRQPGDEFEPQVPL